MLIFYRISHSDLAQKEMQGSEIRHADERLPRHSHQTAAHPIKHPLRDLQLASIVVTWRRTAKDGFNLRGGLACHSLTKQRVPWIDNFADRGIAGFKLSSCTIFFARIRGSMAWPRRIDSSGRRRR